MLFEFCKCIILFNGRGCKYLTTIIYLSVRPSVYRKQACFQIAVGQILYLLFLFLFVYLMDLTTLQLVKLMPYS